jgi:uncharacterized membrane protein YfcA
MLEILGYLASVLVGVVLGLIGGGGSILTVPMKLGTLVSLSNWVAGFSDWVDDLVHYKKMVLGQIE